MMQSKEGTSKFAHFYLMRGVKKGRFYPFLCFKTQIFKIYPF